MDVAIGMLWPWVAEEALPGEVELLMDACPKRLRGHLALLLGDLLGGWPRRVWAVPVLFWCAHSEDREPLERRVVLPTAAGVEPPCPELRFLGWLHRDALLPAGVQVGRLAEVQVGVCGAAVAIFEAEPGLDTNELPGTELRPMWWGSLMAEMLGSVYISVGVVQSYPVALEVARAMSMAAGGAGSGQIVAPAVFATPMEIQAGLEAGMLFRGRAEAALQGSGSWTKGGDDELI